VADFLMPSLGADMEAGTVLEWRVRPGDTVHRGDIVAVIDTEKSTIDVEVFEDGVITELLVEPGQEVPVGTVLAHIAEPATRPTAGAAAAKPAARVPAAGRPRRRPSSSKAAPARRPAPAGKRRRRPAAHARASPLARRRAAERGLALEHIAGSGPGGAVVAADLDRAGRPAPTPPTPAPPAPAPPAPAPPAPRADRQASVRRTIAALMARSNREIPHYHVATTIDLGAALTWLRAANDQRPPAERLLPATLLLKATALATRQVPALNGFWDEDDGFLPSDAVHLGVAVSLRGGGLIAPAIHDADQLTLDELMAALRDLVGRVRSGRLRSSEMADPTITVTNLGDQGVDEVHGVIYPPQVALVGFGRIAERPWARDGMLGVRPTVRATLAADHRSSDGLVGARFLATLDRLLQSPEEL
jgi:pyruvate dehydrogenase E2 component (dihydrolipoamide acetyltransferase)